MNVLTIKEFVKAQGFIQIAPQVRQNTNGYPFATFYTAKNEAENIYFSKAASKKLNAGDVVDAQLLSQHQIAVVKNAAGEERVKLISNSERIDLADLLG